MFVDASAIVAILTREAEADALIDALERAKGALTSPIAIFEAVLGINRKRQASLDETDAIVRSFLRTSGIRVVAITEKETEIALGAFARYGKGRGHPAQLNLGDCFAYAAARRHRATLLFTGQDFGKTDIHSAMHQRRA